MINIDHRKRKREQSHEIRKITTDMLKLKAKRPSLNSSTFPEMTDAHDSEVCGPQD